MAALAVAALMLLEAFFRAGLLALPVEAGKHHLYLAELMLAAVVAVAVVLAVQAALAAVEMVVEAMLLVHLELLILAAVAVAAELPSLFAAVIKSSLEVLALFLFVIQTHFQLQLQPDRQHLHAQAATVFTSSPALEL
jgi:hypothetical protein